MGLSKVLFCEYRNCLNCLFNLSYSDEMIKSKLKGSKFERKVALELSKKGFLVYKGSASKGGWFKGRRVGVGDILAVSRGKKLLVEVKFDKTKLTKKDRDVLISIAREVDAEPYLAYWDDEIKFERVR